MLRIVLTLMLSLLSISVATAENLKLRPNHPTEYVVKTGDTLWGISDQFLENPWLWPQLWQRNPQINNPHLIFPGDVLALHYVNGRPVLSLEHGGIVKLSPKIRTAPLRHAIPPIPLSEIKPFLTASLILDKDELINAPYIVAYAGEHIVGGENQKMYVRGIPNDRNQSFSVFRDRGIYKDPETTEILGYSALHVGDARLQIFGKPSTFLITSSNQEVRIGDRLTPANKMHINTSFYPKKPRAKVEGFILDVIGGVTQIGQHQVVVISKGKNDGLQVGDVLAVYRTGHKIVDPVKIHKHETIQLPNERTGEIMVFRTFSRLSYALVMRATSSIHVSDTVTNPS